MDSALKPPRKRQLGMGIVGRLLNRCVGSVCVCVSACVCVCLFVCVCVRIYVCEESQREGATTKNILSGDSCSKVFALCSLVAIVIQFNEKDALVFPVFL